MVDRWKSMMQLNVNATDGQRVWLCPESVTTVSDFDHCHGLPKNIMLPAMAVAANENKHKPRRTFPGLSCMHFWGWSPSSLQHVNKACTVLLSPFTNLVTLQDSTTTATPHYKHMWGYDCSEHRDTPCTHLFYGVLCWTFIPVSFLYSVSRQRLTNKAKCVLFVCVCMCIYIEIWLFLSSLTDLQWEASELRYFTVETSKMMRWRLFEAVKISLADWFCDRPVGQAVQLCGCRCWVTEWYI